MSKDGKGGKDGGKGPGTTPHGTEKVPGGGKDGGKGK